MTLLFMGLYCVVAIGAAWAATYVYDRVFYTPAVPPPPTGHQWAILEGWEFRDGSRLPTRAWCRGCWAEFPLYRIDELHKPSGMDARQPCVGRRTRH